MTISLSIIRHTFMIKEMASWIEDDVKKGGFSEPGSMSDLDLDLAEKTFLHLAEVCRDQRKALRANVPGPFEYKEKTRAEQ